MSKLQWNEQEKLEFRASPEALLGGLKALHATVGRVMADVAAIRNTVLEDPEDMAVYRANLRLAVAMATPMMDEALNCYDDLLEDLVNSQQYTN